MKTRRTGLPSLRRAPRRRRLAAITALAALALGAAGVSTAAPGNAAAGDPFDPYFPQVLIGQGFGTSLWTGQLSPGTLSLTNTGTTAMTYNAIGFNTVDNYIYGIRAATAQGSNGFNELVRVGQNGVATNLGAVTGLPTPSPVPNTAGRINTYTQGTFAPNLNAGVSTPMLYVRDYNNTNNTGKMWAIDIATKAATVINFASGDVTNMADFTWRSFDESFPSDLRARFSGAFFGATATEFYVITRSADATPVFRVFTYPNTGTGMSGANRQYGGAWTLGNGLLGFSDNDTGNVFYVEVNWDPAPVNKFVFQRVAAFSGTPTSNNDATNSPGADVDLAIQKTGPAHYAVGDTLDYVMTVTNNEDVAWSSGSILTDTPPNVLGNLSTTTPGCTIVSGTLRCVLGALAPGATTEVRFSADVLSAPTTGNGLIKNVANIRGNEHDPDPSNDTDDHDTTPNPPGVLEVMKTSNPASGTQVTPGQLVEYTLTFHNSGGSPIAVDHIDLLSNVLDDAVREGAVVGTAPLSADNTTDPSRIAITGSLAAGQTATVRYSMRVRSPLLSTSNGVLGNFVIARGETPPSSCVPSTGLCTEHPVVLSLSWDKVNDRTPADFLAHSEWTLTPYDTTVDPAALDLTKRIAVTDCVATTAAECTGADTHPAAGRFTLRGLTVGTYQLAETKAPSGYRQIAPIDIRMLDNVNYGPIVNMQVEVPELPLTGGTGTLAFWCATGALGTAAITALLIQRRAQRRRTPPRHGAHARA